MTAEAGSARPRKLEAAELASPYLRACAQLAQHDPGAGARYLGAGRDPDGFEFVELAVDAELGTRQTLHPIHPVERLRLYARDSNAEPIVLTTRDDFPDVPHLNPRPVGERRSLCLYEEPWEEVRLSWTPSSFLRRIRSWLGKSAYGKLQDVRQPLDPMVYGFSIDLVLPSRWLHEKPHEHVRLETFPSLRGTPRVARLAESVDGIGDEGFVLIGVDAGSREHGRLRVAPRHLADLFAMDQGVGEQVRAAFRSCAREAAERLDEDRLGRAVIVLLTIGLQREGGGAIERYAYHAFGTSTTLGEIGEAAGWLAAPGPATPHRVLLLKDAEPRGLDQIGLDTCCVHPALSRARAAEAAGRAPEERRLALVGAGALGSQLARTLAQEGYGRWTLVDDDTLLPHNLARHALGAFWQGFEKAAALKEELQHLLDGDPTVARALVSRLPAIGTIGEALSDALAEAELVLDASASVATARRLLRDGPTGRPMVSLFFNPRGTELVLLGERAIGTADAGVAEATYYRAVCLDEALVEHLAAPPDGVLSSLACREPSAQIPQSRVMRLVGRAAEAVQEDAIQTGSFVTIWQDDADGQRRAVHRTGLLGRVTTVDGWRIVAPEDLIEELIGYRAHAGAIETGGVVLGTWDLPAKELLLVFALGPPSDSVQEADGFRRGHQGLAQAVESVRIRTRSIVTYIGEWHTHPPAHSSALSVADRRFLKHTARIMQLDGLPAVMLVVGEDGIRAAIKDTSGAPVRSAMLDLEPDSAISQ